MRVARSIAPRKVRIEEMLTPDPGPGDVVCDVLACGVCASDVTDWYVAGKVPTVLGHELAGVVRAVGDGAAGADGSPIELGARVAIHHHCCGTSDFIQLTGHIAFGARQHTSEQQHA